MLLEKKDLIEKFPLVAGTPPTLINVGAIQIGGEKIVTMAGPCAVENRFQLLETAKKVQATGAVILRGGAFKPRSSPHSFQGLGELGLKLLADAREETGLLVVTEVMAPGKVELVSQYADILQIGSRNMQNFDLLIEAGRSGMPVLLKRGFGNTLREFLGAAEYILNEGNSNVVLCERGVVRNGDYFRNTFDIQAIPALKDLINLPVIADPSHATGKREYVPEVAKAAIAAGADGLLVEVHAYAEQARVDGRQSLYPEQFSQLMRGLKPIAQAVGRKL